MSKSQLKRIATQKGKRLVKIEWRSPDDDWPYFYFLGVDGSLVHLQGADYPDGSAKHEGDSFWVDKYNIIHMTDMNG